MECPTVPIADFCKTGSGGTPSRSRESRYYGGHIPWVKSGELNNSILKATEEHITDLALAESSAKMIPTGTILVAMYGATVGKTAILAVDAATNQAICHILPDPRLAVTKYLWYILQFKLPELLSRRVGGAQPNISQQIIRRTLIPLPSPSEQRRIVEILDRADALRRKRARADAAAERVLPALFLKMFGDPATNPIGWEVKTLAELGAEFVYGTSEKCYEAPEGLPVLRIPNIISGEIDLNDLKYAELSDREAENLLLHYGDLVFVRTNGNPDYVGRCAVFDLNEKYLFASYLIRGRWDTQKANPWFVASLLQIPAGRLSVLPYIRTTAGQSNLGIKGLEQIPVMLPPPSLQHKYAQQVLRHRQLLKRQATSHTKIDNLFQLLLHRAFSGELTARWREAHMVELLAEMEEQALLLDRRQEEETWQQSSL